LLLNVVVMNRAATLGRTRIEMLVAIAALAGCATTNQVHRTDYIGSLPRWAAEGSATIKACQPDAPSLPTNTSPSAGETLARPATFAAQPVDFQLRLTPSGPPVDPKSICGFDTVDRVKGSIEGALWGGLVGAVAGGILGYADGDDSPHQTLWPQSAETKASLGFRGGGLIGGILGLTFGAIVGHTYHYVFVDK
jgi:hypothetical protein